MVGTGGHTHRHVRGNPRLIIRLIITYYVFRRGPTQISVPSIRTS